MVRKLLVSITCILLFSVNSFSQHVAHIKLINKTSLQRVDELVIIDRAYIEKKLGHLPPGKFVQFMFAGDPVTVQFDDMDRDGKWDQVVMLESFEPREKKQFNIRITDTFLNNNIPTRAQVRQMRKNEQDKFGEDLERDSIPAGQAPTNFGKQPLPPFLTEGPAWENDKVGFRIYFDTRNTKDIWGKTTSDMVLDWVGADPSLHYHELADWGMDILAVGQSLGAGSLALHISDQQRDTMIRLGGRNMGKVIYEKVADGPLRAVFRLTYPQWKPMEGMEPVKLVEEIQVWGGQFFYSGKVWVENAPSHAKLTIGMVNLKSKSMYELNKKKVKGMYSFDRQSENGDNLGMAILLDKKQFHSSGKTANKDTDVRNTYYVDAHIPPGHPVTYRFYAGWERTSGRFKSLASFQDFIKDEALRFQQPLKLR